MGAGAPRRGREGGGWDRDEEAKSAGVGKVGLAFLLATGSFGSGLPVGALRLIYLLVGSVLLISLTLGDMGIYMTDFHRELLYLSGNVVPLICSPDWLSPMLPVGLFPPVQPTPLATIHESV
ncbi:hypothetical protein DUI87_04058 [Hirundo rustica rustica]|uniref:Uncharacterized protein n=1 Tax=Hirundo rustica rustica TaxID=333673 RepID=A0A3M0LK02_HIRRU|nr:hypothetical protein DUI87_04058 [Hirundo rustica rustica]